MKPTYAFGDLLRLFRKHLSLTQATLAQQMGVSERSISDWERGLYLPEDPEKVLKLAALLYLDATETEQLFVAARMQQFSNVKEANAQSVERALNKQDGTEETTELWPSTIPREYYYPLPGREKDLKRLLAALQDPRGVPAVVIDGLGGLGKTALAAEISRRAVIGRHFHGVIGESAKLQEFSGDEIVPVREAILNFDLLLDSLARQLGHWEIPVLKSEEKLITLAHLLHQQSYLVFVDNLETSENANALVAHLRPLLGVSRAIITSRKQVRQDYIQRLSLCGLDLADSLIFLEADMKQRGIHQLPGRERLAEIHEVTGGAPLAMKLVVAQASFLNLDIILKQLRTTGSENLYTFIFRQSWKHLLPVAQRVLFYLGKTAVAPVDWEELSSVEIAENETELLKGVNQVVGYSLVEVSPSVDGPGYGVHQLTRQFVNSELPNLWQEQSLL